MTRKRYEREIELKLECGCLARINTSRYRVSKDLVAILVGGAVRRGIWCFTCNATCMPVEVIGVVRA